MINKVILQAKLMQDIELKKAGETTVGQIRLGTYYKKGGENINQYYDAVAFGKTAEIMATHLRKLSPVIIEGELRYESWADSEGKKKSAVKIIVNQFHFERGEAKQSVSPELQKEVDDLF